MRIRPWQWWHLFAIPRLLGAEILLRLFRFSQFVTGLEAFGVVFLSLEYSMEHIGA